MKSLEVLLAENVGKMSDVQRDKFMKARSSGATIEALVNISESVLSEREPIRRNNGATRQQSVEESRESVMQECDRVLFEGMEKARSNAAGLSQLVEVGGRFLTVEKGREVKESDREDYAFCRQIGLSHEDAVKVLSEGGVR